jgi:hypothetical protein
MFCFLVVAAVVVPPIIVDAFDLAPARWLKSQESKAFGGYYSPELTAVLLMFAYFLILSALLLAVAIPVKRLTGKTLVQLFSKKSPPTDHRDR